MITEVGVGDVLAVHTGTIAGDIVEVAERIAHDAGDHVGHVIIAHHQDKAGTWWGIEGRRGGVGWAELTEYIGTNRFDNDNSWQPRTPAERVQVAKVLESCLGVGYDWVGGIIADAFGIEKAHELAAMIDRWWGWGHGPRPGHVVCSSLAAWVYGTLDLPHPGTPGEMTTPADWWLYNHRKGNTGQ